MDSLRNKIRELPGEVKKAIKAAVIWVMILVVVINPFNSSFVMTVNSQEFFTFHIKDILERFSRDESLDCKGYYLSTGTYEKQKNGELFGVAKNKNLILIQMESLQNMVIGAEYNGQEISPNLNRLIEEKGTLYFDNFYQQIGSGNTSDAEFGVNNSIMGSIESFTYQLYDDNYFKGLPWILKEAGYQTAVFHGYDKSFWNREKMYPVEGFDRFINNDDLVNDHIDGIGGGNIVGISDKAFFEQVSAYLEEMDQQPQPFYSFLITLSSHNPFHLPKSLRGLELLPEDKNIVGNYLNAVHYADQCLGDFLETLKEDGLYDDSVIALYGDHFGLTKSDPAIAERVSAFLGYDYDYDIMLNIPFYIHLPQSDLNKRISISGGQLDIFPTLAYLLGIEQLDTLYLGQNLLTADHGFVAEQTHMLKGSFIMDNTVFEISRDGVFENSRAYDRITREPLDIEPLAGGYLRAKQIVELSDFYLRNDVLRHALLEEQTIQDMIAGLHTDSRMTSKIRMMEVSDRGGEEGAFSMADLVGWMKEHREEPILVLMEDPVEELQRFEEAYCGREAERPGMIQSVDYKEEISYKDKKKRMIPVVRSMKDYTKIEYMGYQRILFMPDLSQYTKPQLAEFIDVNQPWAVAIPADQAASQFQDLLSRGIFVYAYDVKGPTQKAFLNAIGVDGFIEFITQASDGAPTRLKMQ